jgi:predicted RNA binding protein YcfA (HicA-like mRNA interferase family)
MTQGDAVMDLELDRAKILARLTREGWELLRHGADHDPYRHPAHVHPVILPRHRRLTPGVARSIAKLAGWR